MGAAKTRGARRAMAIRDSILIIGVVVVVVESEVRVWVSPARFSNGDDPERPRVTRCHVTSSFFSTTMSSILRQAAVVVRFLFLGSRSRSKH